LASDKLLSTAGANVSPDGFWHKQMKTSKTRLHMKIKNRALLTSLIAVGCMSWSASAATIAGTDLSGLHYGGDPGDAQYVPAAGATPALAALSTPDSGINGDAPVVFVRAANVGLPSLGTLSGLSASYHLYSSSGGNGNQPYWLTYLYAPGGGYIGVISSGGPTLDGSSQIHVFYDYATSPLSSDTYWGDTLSQLDGTAYGTTTFGQLGVYETGVEIGDWNISDSIGATANIDSITVNVNVPDVASTAGLLCLGFLTLAVFGFRQNRLQLAK
jgi:hypothetical protein